MIFTLFYEDEKLIGVQSTNIYSIVISIFKSQLINPRTFSSGYKKISLAGDESDAVQADSKLEGTLQNTLEQKGKKQVLLVLMYETEGTEEVRGKVRIPSLILFLPVSSLFRLLKLLSKLSFTFV